MQIMDLVSLWILTLPLIYRVYLIVEILKLYRSVSSIYTANQKHFNVIQFHVIYSPTKVKTKFLNQINF